MLNLNKLATKITVQEGKKKSISIAQVKEVMALVCRELSKMSVEEVAQVLRKYKK